MAINTPETQREQAVAAMRQAPGQPTRQGNGPEPYDRPTMPSQRSLVEALEQMASDDASDYRELVQTVREFIARKRADWDRRERLLLGPK